MSVAKYVMLVCDYKDNACGGESEPQFTETAARKVARAARWRVGRNRDQPDYCPRHRGAGERGD